jgi:hypothetical protein
MAAPVEPNQMTPADVGCAARREELGRTGDRARGVDHVVDEHARAPLDIADDLDRLGHVVGALGPPLVDEREVGVSRVNVCSDPIARRRYCSFEARSRRWAGQGDSNPDPESSPRSPHGDSLCSSGSPVWSSSSRTTRHTTSPLWPLRASMPLSRRAAVARSTLRRVRIALSGCAGRHKTPDLPSADQLPAIKELPNPFVFDDGSPVRTKRDWEKRRGELTRYLEKLRAQAIIEWKNDDVRKMYEQQVAAPAQAPAP